MERATRALKRSSIRLMSYPELNMIITDLSQVRSAEKNKMKAYHVLSEDLVKWANHDSNQAIRYILAVFSELQDLWNTVQADFLESLKTVRYQFHMILENEHFVDRAKEDLAAQQQLRNKLVKDCGKVQRRAAEVTEEIINERIREADQTIDTLKNEVTEKVNENEVIKMIRLKNGLLKLTEAQMLLNRKCEVILRAQKDVICTIPDFLGTPIQDIVWQDDGRARGAVVKAKECIQTINGLSSAFAMHSLLPPLMALEYDAPPPYSPFIATANSNNRTQTSVSGFVDGMTERQCTGLCPARISLGSQKEQAAFQNNNTDVLTGGFFAIPRLHSENSTCNSSSSQSERCCSSAGAVSLRSSTPK